VAIQFPAWRTDQQGGRVDHEPVQAAAGTRVENSQGVSLRIEPTADSNVPVDLAAIHGQAIKIEAQGLHIELACLELGEFEVGSADGVVQVVQVPKVARRGSRLVAKD
jgi:hypothetical protein